MESREWKSMYSSLWGQTHFDIHDWCISGTTPTPLTMLSVNVFWEQRFRHQWGIIAIFQRHFSGTPAEKAGQLRRMDALKIPRPGNQLLHKCSETIQICIAVTVPAFMHDLKWIRACIMNLPYLSFSLALFCLFLFKRSITVYVNLTTFPVKYLYTRFYCVQGGDLSEYEKHCALFYIRKGCLNFQALPTSQ